MSACGWKRWVAAAGLLVLASPAAAQGVNSPLTDPENTVYLDIQHSGRVLIELRPDLAPKTVARFKELVRKGFYDGLTFHRVIPAFMAQGGDPKGDGQGGSGVNLPAEFSKEKHVRGTVSMARKADDPNSADSQFFIVIREASDLDGKYTIFGRVVQGMDYIDRLKKGSKALDGKVLNPDKIKEMRVVADAPKTK